VVSSYIVCSEADLLGLLRPSAYALSVKTSAILEGRTEDPYSKIP